MSQLLAVPNVSEGRDRAKIEALARALDDPPVPGVRLLDTHSDPDHNRTVFTLSGTPGQLVTALVGLARAAVKNIDLHSHEGVHPRVGALDVAPIVHVTPADRGAACAAALVLADRLGDQLSLPVFLYGVLSEHARTRAEVRHGGLAELATRIGGGELQPDFGPRGLHPTAGAVLVGARPPLVAFNVQLAPPATRDTACEIAALIRDSGAEGLPGVRAIGVALPRRGAVQVATNIEDPDRTTAATVLAAVARHATPASAELVGLAPAAALAGFPAEVPLANRRTIEDTLSI